MLSRIPGLFTQLPCAALVLAAIAAARPAEAHFLWLNTITEQSREPQAFLYFSESAAEQDYRLPERIAKADFWQRVDGQKQPLKGAIVETEARSGIEAPLQATENVILEARCRYGVHHGSLLTYHAKHFADVRTGDASRLRSPDFPLDVVPAGSGEKLQLTVLWEGKPLPGAEVLVDQTQGEITEHLTDEAGRVEVTPAAAGLVGVRAGHRVKDAAGDLDGEPYTGAAYYTTLTFRWSPPETDATLSASYPDLPEPIASFGAAAHDGWLYVYGGHVGQTHAHSRENLSRHFRRLNLKDGEAWEDLPLQTALQSPALVADGKYLYRVGGMTALNAPDQEEDLRSVAEFARFDPQAKAWSEMPALPQPRSSHDAVVIDGKLYVVGGWLLEGPEEREWSDSALVYDLSADDGKWQELPAPEFRRRALAAAEWNGKVVVIGGMTDEREVSQRVDIYDPARREWTQGPDLPDSDRHGFGIAACNLKGSLYVSGALGIVYRLNDRGDAWEEVAELEIPRFFHRLVPTPSGNLLAVAGAAHGHGHLADIESIPVQTGEAAKDAVGKLSARPSE